ncbi:MAG: hypothetical protein HY744_03135 [Deltaproteobacteria bacterium]|nr:hypothetical protein [Deltaproteobacteria bacterium]
MRIYGIPSRSWLALALALAPWACSKERPRDDDVPIRPSALAPTPAAPAVSAAPAAATGAPATALPPGQSAAIPVLAATPVPPGSSPDGRVWLPKFSIRRDDGDQNATVLQAFARCAERGLALCTESQWERACGEDAAVGAIETWTVTFSGTDDFVVRGGQGGCSGRKLARGSERSPARAGACCQRGVGISSQNENRTFLAATSNKMTRYEAGMTRRAGAALGPFIDETINFFGKSYDHDTMVAKYDAIFAAERDQWTVYDTCEVAIQPAPGPGEEAIWTADCRATTERAGKVAFVTHRYTWSCSGKVQRIEEIRVHRGFGGM